MTLLLPSRSSVVWLTRTPPLVSKSASCFRTHSTSNTVPPAPYHLIFMGTDAFAAHSLSALVIHRSDLLSTLHVLTPPDTKQKWGAARMKVSPVKQIAFSNHIAHQEVPTAGMTDYELPSDFPAGDDRSILLTCSFGHLIPDSLLDQFPNPWQRLNIHPSLLPQLRGAAPIQWALARRLDRSGVSIQTLEKRKFDTGRIVAQEVFAFPPPSVNQTNSDDHHAARGMGFLEVEQEMAARAANLLVRTLSNLPTCWERSWDQNEQEKSYAPKLKASHCAIRWDRWSAADVVARERGMAYMYPLSTSLHPPPSSLGTSTFRPVNVNFYNTSAITKAELQLVDPETAQGLAENSIPAGSARFSATLDALIVKTVDGDQQGVLVVPSIKVAGKKVKSAQEFSKAYRDRTDPVSGLFHFQ